MQHVRWRLGRHRRAPGPPASTAYALQGVHPRVSLPTSHLRSWLLYLILDQFHQAGLDHQAGLAERLPQALRDAAGWCAVACGCVRLSELGSVQRGLATRAHHVSRPNLCTEPEPCGLLT